MFDHRFILGNLFLTCLVEWLEKAALKLMTWGYKPVALNLKLKFYPQF